MGAFGLESGSGPGSLAGPVQPVSHLNAKMQSTTHITTTPTTSSATSASRAMKIQRITFIDGGSNAWLIVDPAQKVRHRAFTIKGKGTGPISRWLATFAGRRTFVIVVSEPNASS